MKIIFITLMFYILDIFIYGSIVGSLFVFGYGLENIFDNTEHNLVKLYFIGILWYWLLDSIASKFREAFKEAVEFENENN